jgi:hypothetical protein
MAMAMAYKMIRDGQGESMYEFELRTSFYGERTRQANTVHKLITQYACTDFRKYYLEQMKI